MKKFIFSIMLVFAALFAMPTMAVETIYNIEQIESASLGNSAVTVTNMDIDPGIVSQFRRTPVTAYKAQTGKAKFYNVNIATSCDSRHQTGYSSNEVGWL
ncbi:MAG: hypothetical protein KAT04_14540 [Methylococcales bacterium]|nr:hypothetical protein [Methylococcales bacterium]